MEPKQTFIGEYVNRSPKERLYRLMDLYKDFAAFLDDYKEFVIDLMVMMREYQLQPSDADLGVRVQTSGATSNIPASKAEDRMILEECFEKRKIMKSMFPDPEELTLISTAVYEWDLMESEYKVLKGYINLMKPTDKSIFLPYIKGEKRIADIAEELCLEPGSANTRLYRIRKGLVNKVLPWFKEYKVTVPA